MKNGEWFDGYVALILRVRDGETFADVVDETHHDCRIRLTAADNLDIDRSLSLTVPLGFVLGAVGFFATEGQEIARVEASRIVGSHSGAGMTISLNPVT